MPITLSDAGRGGDHGEQQAERVGHDPALAAPPFSGHHAVNNAHGHYA
jgi:hypothetical protein